MAFSHSHSFCCVLETMIRLPSQTFCTLVATSGGLVGMLCPFFACSRAFAITSLSSLPSSTVGELRYDVVASKLGGHVGTPFLVPAAQSMTHTASRFALRTSCP